MPASRWEVAYEFVSCLRHHLKPTAVSYTQALANAKWPEALDLFQVMQFAQAGRSYVVFGACR